MVPPVQPAGSNTQDQAPAVVVAEPPVAEHQTSSTPIVVAKKKTAKKGHAARVIDFK
jgi:hypothetical protein